jgi:glycosyltransferase involved in cell wall biosynthesis/2-polyprenyl-3-methyl-5-hydroxy-6-metoxy-1,4-benzoquinol methylase
LNERTAGADDRAGRSESPELGASLDTDAQSERGVDFYKELLDRMGPGNGRSILDIGPARDTLLRMAAEREWKSFGVEISSLAWPGLDRELGHRFYMAGDVSRLVPHVFDLIVLFNTLEDVADPVRLFHILFAKGAISHQTRVVVVAANARSRDAVSNPVDWVNRRPSSHLVYYSGEGLTRLFRELRFSSIQLSGRDPSATSLFAGFPDERSELNDTLASFDRLECEATGSDFAAFMRERYVPGTWSTLAGYEHLPRYQLARALSAGRRVLDFGCGTGYGAHLLAAHAHSVLGVDAAGDAIDWAREHYDGPNLAFQVDRDFGEELPEQSFDLITCFEVIEHVAERLQEDMLRKLARLLKKDGVLLISTPNPDVSRSYGPNPYHLRELTRDEFRLLLGRVFPSVEVHGQWIQPSVVIARHATGAAELATISGASSEQDAWAPAAFVGWCSRMPLPEIPATCFLDSNDYVLEHVLSERALNQEALAHYSAVEAKIAATDRALSTGQALARERIRAQDLETTGERERTRAKEVAVALERERTRAKELAVALEREQLWSADLSTALSTRDEALHTIQASRWHRLGEAVRQRPVTLRSIRTGLLLTLSMLTPHPVKDWVRRLPIRILPLPGARSDRGEGFKPYIARVPKPSREDRPRILHVIANFMTGGSSQLVVDLFERVGDRYEQEVVTSFKPQPDSYLNVPVQELTLSRIGPDLKQKLAEFRPWIVHIHYWGDIDEPWYRGAFTQVEAAGLPIIQNVNTPVAPIRSPSVLKYVFVSESVRARFGAGIAENAMVIYPGSDLRIFDREPTLGQTNDCIGMVYRLERDKLQPSSIDPFIKVLKAKPSATALIVGGGSLLPIFLQRVRLAGLAGRFAFAGYVPYEQLPEFYSRLAVFVAPVWQESFGQVAPFAMHMGLPVAGYRVGALPEILGETSLLAPPGDADALARIVLELLDDQHRRVAIGSHNRARAASLFSVEAMVEQYAAVYEGIVKAHPR